MHCHVVGPALGQHISVLGTHGTDKVNHISKTYRNVRIESSAKDMQIEQLLRLQVIFLFLHARAPVSWLSVGQRLRILT